MIQIYLRVATLYKQRAEVALPNQKKEEKP
jgi:hypothetical protein